ncbi:LysR family transcriptional regulator [Streptomyces sp. BG9H]|uniref:LysR family transcriptional regulator n=1 Tax=Streptomyces anatolicus TaxID=2675858 RepID=A0ABS6YWF3_9ACTN|nr:LysR family transcriptional regulator [Streptomyces anatolicus]MBW5424856.1 LysR family transcriptional regulator [Streptomyces anatolicus]
MLDLQKLRVLRELKHRGTLAAVARALSYTPSAISQQLSMLEAEVGAPLREQSGRGVRLTAQAEILVAHTEIVLEQLERAEAELAASMEEIAGTVRLACFQTAALAVLPAALAQLQRTHPRLRVETTQVEPEHALPKLMTRDFDLVVAEEYPYDAEARQPNLERRELCVGSMRLALPPPSVAVSDRAALRRAAALPWIMEPVGTAARRWAMALCREAGFEPDVRFETTDVNAHLRCVQQGHAVALLPDLLWQGKPPTLNLYELPQGWGYRRIVTAVRKGGGQQPAIRLCHEALEAALPGPR